MSYRYSVLTFVIGKGYERVHEISGRQDDVEYVLVTDDPDLRSGTWKVVYDEGLLAYKTPFERCFRIRYGAFRYCSSDTCVTIDGSMEVKGSLDRLIAEFDAGGYDICLMPHPLWDDMVSEYSAWVRMRGYPKARARRALKFLSDSRYDFSFRGLYQLCFTVKRRTYLTKRLDDMTMAAVQYLSDETEFERLDQTIFSYVANRYFSGMKVFPVSEQVVRSSAIQWYWHNSDRPKMNVFYDISRPDVKYVFNRPV